MSVPVITSFVNSITTRGFVRKVYGRSERGALLKSSTIKRLNEFIHLN